MAAAPTIDRSLQGTKRSEMLSRVTSIEKGWNEVRPVLADCAKYIAPYRGQWESVSQTGNARAGKRRDLAIINNTAGRSMGILASGMMSGLTSPGRPWFRLTTPDPDLAEFTPHRRWLDDVARAMRNVFARSNLYNVLPSVYSDLGPFGTSVLHAAKDAESVIRFYPYPIGSYGLAQDERLVVDTFSRRYQSTVRNVVNRWGTSEHLSQRTRLAYQGGRLEEAVELIHLIRPNYDRKAGAWGPAGTPFVEEYWEAHGDATEPLAIYGLPERALFAPRWDVNGTDVWGVGIGHSILGDVKHLQFLERRKEDVLEKHTAPPLEAGIELRGKRISLLAGDVTYTNPGQTGGAQVRPIVQTNPAAFQYAMQAIQDRQQMIRQACYEDLFLMLANDTRSGITAREVEERHQEKLLVLGPVLERLNEELLDPIIDRTFAEMQRQSLPVWQGVLEGGALLPPPPPDMEDVPLRVEYISILAQAAKATNTRGLEAFGMFVGQLAQFDQNVVRKVDWMQMVDEYADAQGVPARVVRSDDDVQADLAADAQQAQMGQMAAMAPALKDAMSAMKDAAGTVPQPGSLAENLAAAAGGGFAGPPP